MAQMVCGYIHTYIYIYINAENQDDDTLLTIAHKLEDSLKLPLLNDNSVDSANKYKEHSEAKLLYEDRGKSR